NVFQDFHEQTAIADEKGPVRQRPVYRYSVIPGGVDSPEELGQKIQNDKVVADHYRGFAVQRAYMTKTETPQLVHVSYRVQDKVYWTRNKLKLPAGERLIGDGEVFARARCGNQISASPQEPTLVPEPPLEELENPEPVVPPAVPVLVPP